MIGAFALITLGLMIWALVDFKAYSGFVMGHPGTSAIIGFVLLWLAVLAQMPLATVTALIGVAGRLAFGMNLFIIRSIDLTEKPSTVMRGGVPFVLADFVKIILIMAFPALSLWLPSTM